MKKDWTENLAEETETVVDKAKGYGNQAKGKIKEVVSDLTDDAGMRIDAEKDKLKGQAQVKGAEAKDFVRDSTEELFEGDRHEDELHREEEYRREEEVLHELDEEI